MFHHVDTEARNRLLNAERLTLQLRNLEAPNSILIPRYFCGFPQSAGGRYIQTRHHHFPLYTSPLIFNNYPPIRWYNLWTTGKERKQTSTAWPCPLQILVLTKCLPKIRFNINLPYTSRFARGAFFVDISNQNAVLISCASSGRTKTATFWAVTCNFSEVYQYFEGTAVSISRAEGVPAEKICLILHGYENLRSYTDTVFVLVDLQKS
jgi:hypothetical protein